MAYDNIDRYFVHEKAIVDTSNIGDKTRIWAFTHILKGAVVGDNCNICEHVYIEDYVILGNDVTVKCGVYIWEGVYVEDKVFIGPCVTFTNDKHPRSKEYPDEFLKTIIKKGATLGANSSIMCGITIGKWATIGMGTVVLKDVKPYEVVVGNPGKVIGYNCECGKRLNFNSIDNSICECGLEYKKHSDNVERVY